MYYNIANAPTANSWYHYHVLRHNDKYTVQIAYQFTTSTCPVYIRTQTNGNWNSWRLFNQGTAKAAQVLSGYTFSSANGVNLSGSMVNRGNLNWSGSNTTYSVPAGYYSGGTLDSRTSYNNGRTQGRNDVKNSPGSYGLYTKSKCDEYWTDGYNNGRKIKHKQLTLKSSSGTYGFKTYWGSTTKTVNMYYLEYNWNETHQIHSAYAYDTSYREWFVLCENSRIFQHAGGNAASLELTHPGWNTGGYFPFSVNYANTNYVLEIWYT